MPIIVTLIVHDTDGQAFSLDTSGGSNASYGWARPSLRDTLGLNRSVQGVLGDASNRDALAQALVELRLCRSDEAVTLTMAEVAARAKQAFASGRLQLVPYEAQLRPICEIDGVIEAEDLDTHDPDEPEIRPTHTLEIVLIGEDDGPIPGQPFRVELPGGEVVEGRLNGQGRAMLTGIEQPGSCTITFPELDEGAWEPARV